MVEGTPNLATHTVMNASATVSAVILGIGIASGQRVNLSIHASRYKNPLEGGSGPTRSRCTLSNQMSGVGNGMSGAMVYLWTLALWHCM